MSVLVCICVRVSVLLCVGMCASDGVFVCEVVNVSLLVKCVCLSVLLYVCLSVLLSVCVCVCVFVSAFVCLCQCLFLFGRVCVSASVCLCLYLEVY